MEKPSDWDEKSQAIELALYIKKKYLEYSKNVNKRIISPIKLQKSLYFLFFYFWQFIRNNKENKDSVEVDYSNYSEYLFDDRIEAWTYGPVVPRVFIADKEGKLNKEPDENYLNNEKDVAKKEFIDNLLEELFEIDDFSLVRISHEDDCWRKQYNEEDKRHNREIQKEDIINEYYKKQIG